MGTPDPSKPVVISGHAKQRMAVRGVSEAEVVEAIRTAPWQPARLGRFECRHDREFAAEWNGKRYDTKQIRPIFVDEAAHIVVVTVTARYF